MHSIQIIALALVLSGAVYRLVELFKKIIAAKPAWETFFNHELWGFHYYEIVSLFIGMLTGVVIKLLCVTGFLALLTSWGVIGLEPFITCSWAMYIVAGLYAGAQTTVLVKFFSRTTAAPVK
jgi:hypothetical protein